MKLSPVLKGFAAALLFTCLAACQKPAAPEAQAPAKPTPPPAPKLVSAEPTSFDAIAKHLDPGGSAYCYFSTETFIKECSKTWPALVPTLIASGTMEDAQKAKVTEIWNTVCKAAAKSGLNEISGFGSSTIALEPGYYQTRWMLHHYAEQGNGLLWKLSSATPNALDLVSYLPANTAAASSGNLKLEPIWKALTDEAVNNPDLKLQLDQAAAQFQQKTGLDLAALLSSLGPNYSLVVTLDESRPTNLPVKGPEGEALSIPEPALLICIQVQDDVLINRVDQEVSKNPMVTKSEEDGLSLRTFALPIPVPFLRPTIAWKKGLFILSSSDLLIREMLAIKAGKKPGLAANAQFTKLMTGMPANGSKFGYVTPLFQKTVNTLQMVNLAQNQKMDPNVKKLLETIYKMAPSASMCSMTEETPEGWVGIRHADMRAPAVAK